MQIVRRDGTPALTLRGVAARAGVSHMAPYRHFPDKSSLLAAIAEEGFLELRERMVVAIRRETALPERVIACGVAYVMFAVDQPNHFRLMFGGVLRDFGPHPALRKAATIALSLLAELIEDCRQKGLIRSEDISNAVGACWCTAHGAAVLSMDGRLALKGFARSKRGIAAFARAACGATIRGFLRTDV